MEEALLDPGPGVYLADGPQAIVSFLFFIGSLVCGPSKRQVNHDLVKERKIGAIKPFVSSNKVKKENELTVRSHHLFLLYEIMINFLSNRVN